MGLSIIVLGIIIVLAFITVVLVIYFGVKEDLHSPLGAADSSEAVRVWQKRAVAMQTLAGKLLGEGGDMQPAVKATASGAGDEDAEKEAKRQAALARKAARSNPSGAES